MVRRVLVGFDGSPLAGETLSHAARLAQADHASLVVVLALPWPCLAPGPMTAMAAHLVRECEAELERSMRRAVDALPDDVSVTFLSRHGGAATCLRRTAEEHGCDVIVVSETRLARRLRLRRSPIEIVVAPEPARARRRGRRAARPSAAPAPATPP
jgi:nucleotide-binding universal stress UspA family protein